MSLNVTPQELVAAAQALSGVHRDAGVDGVKTAGTLDAQDAGHAMVAGALQEVCAKIEFGASAFRAIILATEIALCRCAQDYTLADVGAGKVFSRMQQEVREGRP